MATRKVRPYRFQNIPKYSMAQANMLATFTRYLDLRPLREDQIRKDFQKISRENLKVKADLSFDSVKAYQTADIVAKLPDHPIAVVVGMPPSDHKMLWELDPPICLGVIDNLLGGGAKPMRIHRGLTDVEQGVLSYMLLQVLALVQGSWQGGSQLALRLERFLDKEGVSEFLTQDDNYQALVFRIYYGDVVGYSRVFIPGGVVGETFATPEPQSSGPLSPDEADQLRSMLKKLGDIPVMARARCAGLNLGPDDMAALEEGDIVLLEDHRLTLEGGLLNGAVTVQLGSNGKSVINTQIVEHGGYYDLQIIDIAIQEEPMAASEAPESEEGVVEEPMPEEGAGEAAPPEEEAAPPPAPDDNFEQNEGLLQDVPAPIVVELGRIKTNTSQVIRFRPGQVLRLGRGPDDPVDLVVNNRLFARGMLIEVEGELGVRINELA